MKNQPIYIKIKQVIILMLSLLFINDAATAQTGKNKIKEIHLPFEAARFDTTGAKAAFTTFKNTKALQITTGKVTLKDFNFTNGTIELDARPTYADKEAFISVYFRWQNANESECVYLRTRPDETEQRNTAIQYTPILHGVNLWNVMEHYQGPAQINNNSWNHFKIVVSGLQMRVYVNNMDKPTLEIPRIEGESASGTLAFAGPAYFANLVVKPNETEGLSPMAGADLTNHDVNYIRRWDVSTPHFLDNGRELMITDLPADAIKWKPIIAERRGLINLIRPFGGMENRGEGVQNKTRVVWLKTTIHSTKDQVSKMQLGFNNEVWVFINGYLLYLDKNQYGRPMAKYPNGRLSINNSVFDVPLKAGDNEITIGISNYFYGWGIMARMVNMDGLTVLQK
ncbi:LamG domain-containing protein [Mucilaginibacter segetis]|uniref:DUF1080 domain-containing protein n=1 Tax=Mucilaginibacter segetis TaxID=2793071 RepID=A0A934UKS0_9SPHI|nr:hypothetical protein [Mucilaginibacter segetis]MBK0377753.1 hypothetical protein [Mucilaginibacter segetis]